MRIATRSGLGGITRRGSHSSTVTNASRSVSAIGRTTSSTESPPLESLTDRTFPTGIDAGNDAEVDAARGDGGAGLGQVVGVRFEAGVDEEVLAVALPARGAGDLGAEQPDADGEVGVGDELHGRAVVGDQHDLARRGRRRSPPACRP